MSWANTLHRLFFWEGVTWRPPPPLKSLAGLPAHMPDFGPYRTPMKGAHA